MLSKVSIATAVSGKLEFKFLEAITLSNNKHQFDAAQVF